MRAPVPPTVKPILDEPVQGIAPTNIDNLSIARRSTTLYDEPTIFMIMADVEAIFKREK